jgi:hypothetical protein
MEPNPMKAQQNPGRWVAIASVSAVGLALQVAWLMTIATPLVWAAEGLVADLF